MKLDPITRERLAERAKQRRILLGIPRTQLAVLIGVSGLTMMQWERLLPQRAARDWQWETALRVPAGWLRDAGIEAPPIAIEGMPSDLGEDTFAQFMHSTFTWYAKTKRAERTTDQTLLSPRERRIVEILCRRYGFQGEEKSTLQAIGDDLGLTRERFRQIVENASLRFEAAPVPAGLVERLHQALAGQLPFRVAHPPAAVRDILGGALSLEGADRFFREVLGRPLVRISAHGNHDKMVVADDAADEQLVRAVRQAALAMVRQAGAAQLFMVAGAVLAQGLSATPAQVAECARMFGGFEWLVEDEGWFWFGPDAENRVKTAALKVLSVANRAVDIEEVYAAIARSRIAKGPERLVPASVSLPLAVLQVLLCRIPEVRQSHFNDYRLHVFPEQAADARDKHLSPSEAIIRAMIVENGGIVTRRALTRALVGSGKLEKVTLNMTLFVSPVFRRHDRGLWTLAGYSFSVEALQSAVTERDQLQLVDGWYEVEVALPRSAFERGDWFVPAATVPYLSDGEYEVEGTDTRTRFVTNAIGYPYLKGFGHIAASAGVGVDVQCVFGIAGTGRTVRLREARSTAPSTEYDGD